MRLASLMAVLALSSPALAAELPSPRFYSAWAPLPSLHFSPFDRSPDVHVLPAHATEVPAGVVDQAFASAGEITGRRDLAIDEIAAGWEPARRTALEDLRDAQRAYAASAGDDAGSRGQRFVALLKQVVDDNGRSASRDPSPAGDEVLGQVYARVIRGASDDKLAAIEASETAWSSIATPSIVLPWPWTGRTPRRRSATISHATAPMSCRSRSDPSRRSSTALIAALHCEKHWSGRRDSNPRPQPWQG